MSVSNSPIIRALEKACPGYIVTGVNASLSPVDLTGNKAKGKMEVTFVLEKTIEHNPIEKLRREISKIYDDNYKDLRGGVIK